MQRGTHRALSCPHTTVAKSMKDRNGIPMTRLLEGHGGLWQGGRAFGSSHKVKEMWTSDDQEVHGKWQYCRAQHFRVYRAFSDPALRRGRDD